jgi:hypothetical protein
MKAHEALKRGSLLFAMEAEPGSSIRQLAASVGISKSATGRKMIQLATDQLVDSSLKGGWKITPKGRKAICVHNPTA